MNTTEKIVKLFEKYNIDIYETNSLAYGSNGVLIYGIEIDDNKVVYEGIDDDYRVLTDESALTELYNELRVEYEDVHISELSQEHITDIVGEIVWNSLFEKDYENSYGVKARLVSYYAEGFLESLLGEDFPLWDDALEYVANANRKEIGKRFYEYIQSIEV